MKRTLTAVLLTALLTLSLCACGQSGTETADVDLASLGQELTALCGEDLYELDGDTIKSVQFTGGCDGNLKAISKLVAGQNVDDIVAMMEGHTCGRRSTSCVDQMTKAIREAQAKAAEEA